MLTPHEVTVTADAEGIPIALDGEALTMETPVHCSITPGALHVRVPRDRPGAPPAPRVEWRSIGRIALGRPSQAPSPAAVAKRAAVACG
ncbi:hypothetical protein ACWEP4_30040 [Streptomyces sp. NPDC004227]